jgi:hypothetical protein
MITSRTGLNTIEHLTGAPLLGRLLALPQTLN